MEKNNDDMMMDEQIQLGESEPSQAKLQLRA